MAHTFDFNISDVASLLELNVRHRSSRSLDVDCPLCQKKGKLNLNVDRGCWRCNYCGHSGGMIALYAEIVGCDNQSAYREICEALKLQNRANPNRVNVQEYQPLSTATACNTVSIASLEDRDQTYRMLFSMLTLSQTHKDHLLARGLSSEDILKFGYKSTPAFGFKNLTASLLKLGCRLEGVPGFYQKEGQWLPRFSSNCTGIIVPVMSADGLIQGAQIRLDRPVNDRKYIWFSSSEKDGGVGSGSPVHFIGDPAAQTVYITEGALKATVAHALSGKTFAAIAGVNQYGALETLLQQLKRNGTTLIVEAYDMDKLKNDKVEAGCQKLLSLCQTYGFEVKRLQWNPTYKGIDDFLATKKIT